VTISTDIQKRVAAIMDEQNVIIKERQDVIHGSWVARIGQLHLNMLGPGGTGKSFLVRDLVRHIEDAVYFETALDETTDPGQVFGPPDIKAMVEDGKTRRVITGMLPEATDAFVDEIFNGNSPTMHSLMPAMNERIFHNNGIPMNIPLRCLYSGTNKLNADADLAAFWDRLHLRYEVGYIQGRDSKADMVGQAIARMVVAGRGTVTSIAENPTLVTIAELDQAHAEALSLDVSDAVMNTFLDLQDELRGKGIQISDRRAVEGMVAVLANAWVRGHEDVQVGDLDILSAMWWTLRDQAQEARKVILEITNPGEKAALELLDRLDALKGELGKAEKLDDVHKRRAGVEAVKNADKLLSEAGDHLKKAKDAGTNTTRLDDVVGRAEAFKIKVGEDIFGIKAADLAALSKV
jgi:MoxR-like ATPase